MENIAENVLDPIEKVLSPDIFIKDKDIVQEKVKNYILDTFLKWFYKMGYEKKNIKSVYIIGSSVGFQYNEASDIDVSVEVDNEEIAKQWGLLPNGNILPNTKHPINYYLTLNKKDVEISDNAYDLLNDKWLKKPSKEKNTIPISYVIEISKFFTAGLLDRLSAYEQNKMMLEMYKKYSPEKEEINKDELNKLIAQKELEVKADFDALRIAKHIIKAFRKEAYIQDEGSFDLSIDISIKKPNYSINNQIYKLIEEYGYMEKLLKLLEQGDKDVSTKSRDEGKKD